MRKLLFFLSLFLISSLFAQSPDYSGDFDLEDFAETIPYLGDTDEINEYLNSGKGGPNNLDLDFDKHRDFLSVTIKRGDRTNERIILVDAILKPIEDMNGEIHEQRIRVCDVVIRRIGYLVEVELYGEIIFGEEVYLYRKFILPREHHRIYHNYRFYDYEYYNPSYCGRFFFFLYDVHWTPYYCTWHWRYYHHRDPYPWFYTRVIIVNHYNFYVRTRVRREIRHKRGVRSFVRGKTSRVIVKSLQNRRMKKNNSYYSKRRDFRRRNSVYRDKKMIRSSKKKSGRDYKKTRVKSRKRVTKPKAPKNRVKSKKRIKTPKVNNPSMRVKKRESGTIKSGYKKNRSSRRRTYRK